MISKYVHSIPSNYSPRYSIVLTLVSGNLPIPASYPEKTRQSRTDSEPSGLIHILLGTYSSRVHWTTGLLYWTDRQTMCQMNLHTVSSYPTNHGRSFELVSLSGQAKPAKKRQPVRSEKRFYRDGELILSDPVTCVVDDLIREERFKRCLYFCTE